MSSQEARNYNRYSGELERLLELTPSYADLLNRRGLLRYHWGEWAAARQDFVAALSRNPNYEEARVNLAFAVAPEDPSGAVQIIAGLAKASSKPCVRFVDMACLCYAAEKSSEAWDALYHAIGLDPKDPRPHPLGGHFRLERREGPRGPHPRPALFAPSGLVRRRV